MSALRFAIDLAEAAHGQVTALHVVNMTPVYLESLDPNGYPAGSDSILSELSREATEHFARAKGELKTSIEPGFRVEIPRWVIHQR